MEKLGDKQLAEIDGRIAVAKEVLAKNVSDFGEEITSNLGDLLDLILVLKNQILYERNNKKLLIENDERIEEKIAEILARQFWNGTREPATTTFSAHRYKVFEYYWHESRAGWLEAARGVIALARGKDNRPEFLRKIMD